MVTIKCCICYEYENKPASINCHFCKEGCLCWECYTEYENKNNEFYLFCPCCKSLFISHSIRNIIINALFYKIGITTSTTSNTLMEKWLENFYHTDVWKECNK